MELERFHSTTPARLFMRLQIVFQYFKYLCTRSGGIYAKYCSEWNCLEQNLKFHFLFSDISILILRMFPVNANLDVSSLFEVLVKPALLSRRLNVVTQNYIAAWVTENVERKIIISFVIINSTVDFPIYQWLFSRRNTHVLVNARPAWIKGYNILSRSALIVRVCVPCVNPHAQTLRPPDIPKKHQNGNS